MKQSKRSFKYTYDANAYSGAGYIAGRERHESIADLCLLQGDKH